MLRGVLLAAAAIMVPGVASAVTYDAVADYGAPYFSYGYGSGAAPTPFTNSYAGGCFGVSSLACMTSGSDSVQPVIGKNNGATQTTGTVTLPSDALLLHPGPDGTNSDAVLSFVVPKTTAYSVSGFFQRLDNTANGNGVTISTFYNGAQVGSPFVIGPASGNPLTPFSTGGFQVPLNKGDVISIAVGNNGEYTYDSTGLSLTFAHVPEPAAWGLMVAGLGLIGAALRYRRRKGVVTA